MSNFNLEPEIDNNQNYLKIKSLKLHNFRFFGDDENYNIFHFNSKNTIIYGENGSGKSSIFKAFQFLAKDYISQEEFQESKNRFTSNNTELKFELSNGRDIMLDDDHLEILDYQRKLSLLKPILDYKSLLKLNYRDSDFYTKSINIFPILKELFKNYQIENGETLFSISNPDIYFEKLENIVSNLLTDVQKFLLKLSDDFYLEKFSFKKEFSDNLNGTDFIVNMELKYQDLEITKHHLFFNEARLSALAISIYFSIIKKFSEFELEDSIRVLILDDLLISLDMSNRLKLLNVLQDDFSDFQIIFLTHDKELFEVYKSYFDTKYEIFLQKDGDFEKPFIKKHLDYFESAEKYFSAFDYPACANYLRKEVERLKNIKKKQMANRNNDEVLLKKFKKLLQNEELNNPEQYSRTIGKLIGFKSDLESETSPEIEFNISEIKSITDRILNPYSHDDTSRPLYKSELENAINIIREIRESV